MVLQQGRQGKQFPSYLIYTRGIYISWGLGTTGVTDAGAPLKFSPCMYVTQLIIWSRDRLH